MDLNTKEIQNIINEINGIIINNEALVKIQTDRQGLWEIFNQNIDTLVSNPVSNPDTKDETSVYYIIELLREYKKKLLRS